MTTVVPDRATEHVVTVVVSSLLPSLGGNVVLSYLFRHQPGFRYLLEMLGEVRRRNGSFFKMLKDLISSCDQRISSSILEEASIRFR